MRSFVEKFKVVVFGQVSEKDAEEGQGFEFVKSRKSILMELHNSKNTGALLGIICQALGEGMFITAVEDLLGRDSDQVVVLKPYDMSGHIFSRTHISLSEIRLVSPFNAFYRNPFFISWGP